MRITIVVALVGLSAARALTQARARAIGLLLSRSVDQLEVDPFFVRFLAGVERTLAHSDHHLVLRVAERVGLGAYTRLAASGRVDGFLLCDVEVDDPRFELLAEAGLPAVVAGRPVSPCPFPSVETEHAAGMRLAAEHLLSLGHREIAFVGGAAHLEHVQTRLAIWRTTLLVAGVEPGPVVHSEAGIPAVLDARPTAIVAATDALATGVLAAARERGIAVPGELSITGFDDSPLAALATPPLTSVRIDYADFGAVAAAAALAELGGEPVPEYRAAAPELVIRGSTAAPTLRG